MEIIAKNNEEFTLIKNNKSLFIALFLSLLPIIALFSWFQLPTRYLVGIFVLPILMLASLNFNLIFMTLTVSLFVNYSFHFFAVSEILSLFVCISFILTHKFYFKELKNGILGFYFFFLLTTIPSYLNTSSFQRTFPLFFHQVAFFLLLLLVPVTITKYDEIKKYLNIYLLFAIINSVNVFFEQMATKQRSFGFAGVMYVDLVGIALVISVLSVYYFPKRRMLYSIISLILVIGLIYTQTRNSMLSTSFVLFLMMIHFTFQSSRLGYNRKKVILAIFSLVLGFVLLIFIINSVNPAIFSRLAQNKFKSTLDVANNITDISSFATRFFIWHTAWNAFLAHPFIGIGFYSFPSSSLQYFNLTPFLYYLFVENRTAHTTVLALLSEIGIVGFTGFIFFIVGIFKLLLTSLRSAHTKDELFYSTLFFWLQNYIIVSMIMTDAWLWGNLIILWAILLGFAVVNYRIVFSQNLTEVLSRHDEKIFE